LPGDRVFIGNHEGSGQGNSMADKAQEILHDTLKSFNGHGIYRSPKSHGFGANPYPEWRSSGCMSNQFSLSLRLR
jgi:hypothetical protein